MSRLPAVLERELKRDAQLTYLEYYAMAGLSEQPNHSMRMSTLAAASNAELSRTSYLVSRLEQRRYVRREPDPSDGRYTNVVLTEAGLAQLEAAAPDHVANVRALVMDALSPDELAALNEATDRINERLGVD